MSKAKFEIRAIGDLGELKRETLEGVNKAIVTAAFKVRDDARNYFMTSKTLYKNATEAYDKLAGGINVGKLVGGTIKVHAFGDGNSQTTLWKSVFFVGGTLYRSNGRGNKGRIAENNALDKAVQQNINTLDKYINNVLKEKENKTHG